MINRNDHVVYDANAGRCAAIVRRLYRDGSATVETRFFLDDKGREKPCYLGFKVRLALGDLTQRFASTGGPQ